MAEYKAKVKIGDKKIGPIPAKDSSAKEAERIMKEIILPLMNRDSEAKND